MKTAAFFEKRGLEQARLNAELLFAQALGCRRLDLYLQFERPLPEETLERLRVLVARRAKREPLQYIAGEAEFMDLKLRVDRRALIPRPETEELLEGVFARVGEGAPARVLDLGTGTGAIALALAQKYPGAAVTAVEASGEALSLARENAQRTGLGERVRFLGGAWFEPVAGEVFDLIVSNPPYLTPEEVAQAQPEVRDWEPLGALVSGPEGLDDLFRIMDAAPEYLRAGGLLALETGIGHAGALSARAQAAGFARYEAAPDLSGRQRFFFAWV